MRSTNVDILLGTTAMLTFGMCIVVLVFIIQLMRVKRNDAGRVYKDWVLFTGITLTVTSLLYSAIGEPYLRQYGFTPDHLVVLNVYNSFIRFLGVSFLFTWAAIFEAFEIGEKIIQRLKRKKEA